MSEILRGRYEPIEEVGRGGQGVVLRALDHQHGRQVALKVRVLEGPQDRELALREARLLLDLEPHPGLPLVREDFFENDRYYLVVDWIEGENLQHLLDRRGPLPLHEARAYLAEAAAALEHLHGHAPAVVHHDVKPANLIRTEQGRVVLVDFGIAARGGTLQATQGTHAFRAPEALSGAEAAPAADVFGLSATALALLSGAPPRPGPRPPLPGVDDQHADRVWAALNAGLSFDPSRRPASAARLVESLTPPDTPNNLPAALTRFIGRSGDVAALRDQVARQRLVTVTGAGGLGKTRLALEAASGLLHDFPAGVWLLELAPVADGRLIAQSAARLLGVSEEPGRAVEDAVGDTIGDGAFLLVLDNCEHLAGESSRFAEHLLARCRRLHVLATSRRTLGIAGELVHHLEALTTPSELDSGARAIAASEAVGLFCDRAALASPAFELDDAIADVVARICRRLDGLPLAIELAAARVTHLHPDEIEARLDDRFALLTTGARTTLPRQQTLRGAVEWSYGLLGDGERKLLAALSAFAEGFTLDAAEAVAAAAGTPRAEVLDALAELVSASLLETAIRRGGTRYRMLETIRAYASERLEQVGRPGDVAAAFVGWAAATATAGTSQPDDGPDARRLSDLEAEHGNLRAALRAAIERGFGAEAVRLCSGLAPFWHRRGHWTEGRHWLEEAAKMSHAAREIAILERWSSELALAQGEYAAAQLLADRAREAFGYAGDDGGVAATLIVLSSLAEARADFDESLARAEEGLTLYRALSDERGAGRALTRLGRLAEAQQDWVTARKLHQQALDAYRALGDALGMADALAELAYVAQYTGDPLTRELLDESLGIYRDLGDRQGEARTLLLLAIRSFLDGDPHAALSLGQQSLAIRSQIGDRLGVTVSVEALAGLAAFVGQHERSARLFGAAEVMREVLQAPVAPSDRDLMSFGINLARAGLGDGFDAAWAAGRRLDPEAAVAEALKDQTGDGQQPQSA